MLLRIEQGKGRKDLAMLSPQLLELLRDWWGIERPRGFPGKRTCKAGLLS
jgi:integrase/recombinase XerD